MLDLNRKAGTLLDLLEDIRANMKAGGKNFHTYHLNPNEKDCVECQIYNSVEEWIKILISELKEWHELSPANGVKDLPEGKSLISSSPTIM